MFAKDKIIQFGSKKSPKPSISKGYSLYNEGLYLYNIDNLKQAFIKFKQAEKLGYEDCEMFMYMAWCCDNGQKQNPELVLNYINKAIDCDDENAYCYYMRGRFYYFREKYDLAIEDLLKALNLGFESDDLYASLARSYDWQKDTMKALAYASTGISKYPNSTNCYAAKGIIYYYQGQFRDCLKYFLKSEELGYAPSYILFNISYSYSELGEVQKALEYANKMIFKDKSDASAYYRKGFIYYQQEDFEQALKCFLEAEKLGLNQNDLGGMYSRLSWIYQSIKNDNQKALAYSNKALSFKTIDTFDYYRMGCLQLYGLENYSEALKYFKKAYKNFDSTSLAYNELLLDFSAAYYSLKKYKLALKLIDEGLEKYQQVDNINLLKQKVIILYKTKSWNETREILDYLFEADSEDTWTLQALGIVSAMQKDYDKAISIFEKVKDDLKEINPWGYAFWSLSLYNKKQIAKSLDVFFEYSKYEDMKNLEYWDKVFIRKHIKRLEKFYPNSEKITQIKSTFSSILD